MLSINMINEQIKLNLLNERYEHSVRVAETARMLALRFNLNADKAYIAGLLHDCAKDMNVDKLIATAIELGIEINEVQRQKPLKFLHPQIGAYIAKNQYGVNDKEILQAIRYHHEGSLDMTVFDKIIALSDMVEPNRSFADVNELRKILETNIDEAYFCAYKNIITNHIKINSFLEDNRIRVYNHLLSQRSTETQNKKLVK